MILGARHRLAAGCERDSKVVSKKHASATKPVSHFGDPFRAFRDFLTFHFSFFFAMTSDSEVQALWRRKGTQKEVFGEPFRRDFEVSGESENGAPV